MPKAATTRSTTMPARLNLELPGRSGVGEDRDAEANWARMRGISYVAGKELAIKQLLGGFWPTDNVADDIRRIEMITPFIRPHGCGPVAPQDWLVLRTYAKILEMRDETRMDDAGLAIGDRTFKRCYQTAMEDMASTPGAASNASKKAEIIQAAFRPIMDKMWHRYLFPFGTYSIKANTTGNSKYETDFKKNMSVNSKAMMNKYSVTAADILYLCNTGGYMERFIYIIGVIMWAKRHGFNLLHHRHSTNSINKLDEYYTLEKHLHVFGSILLHQWVMESNKLDVGGNWGDILVALQGLLSEAISDFGLDKNTFESRVKDLTIKSVNGSFSDITSHFNKAVRIQEAGK